jgi:hypothetical protein
VAASETKSVIVLTSGAIESSETPEEVQKRLFRGGEALKQVVDRTGRVHWVNPDHVVQIHEPADFGAGEFR